VLTDEPPTRKQAARGALLGAACGDAVGAPFEGSRAVSRTLVENWLTSARAMRYTDDTAMTLVLARHLITTGGMIEEDRLARDFAEEWQAEPDRGYGAGPPVIFRAVLAGEDWWSVARNAFQGTGSWGNGGAMRVAPVALLPYPVAERVRLARRQAAVTHAHPLAQDGAAMQCAAIAQAATTAGERLDAAGFCAALEEHVTTPEFHEALEGVQDVARAGVSPRGIATRLGANITALGSVPTAVAFFLSNPDDLEAALICAVLAGGDTDTIASMTGAITGARTGLASVPARVIGRLENADEIIDLADQLASLDPSAPPSLH
jgi:poly(ADP-ribose) glycohydrolase ARH3